MYDIYIHKISVFSKLLLLALSIMRIHYHYVKMDS